MQNQQRIARREQIACAAALSDVTNATTILVTNCLENDVCMPAETNSIKIIASQTSGNFKTEIDRQ